MTVPSNHTSSPHPMCPLCDDDRACKFHRASSPRELADALATAVHRSAVNGFIEFLEAAFAGIDEQIPPPIRAKLAKAAVTKLNDELEKALSPEEFDSDNLRRLSAVAFALSIAIDAREESTEDFE